MKTITDWLLYRAYHHSKSKKFHRLKFTENVEVEMRIGGEIKSFKDGDEIDIHTVKGGVKYTFGGRSDYAVYLSRPFDPENNRYEWFFIHPDKIQLNPT